MNERPATVAEATPEWLGALHELLGASPDCVCWHGLDAAWIDLPRKLGIGPAPLGSGLDGSLSIGRACYAIVRHQRSERVVETGVARGITSRAILEGLEANGAGELWSVDLPPLSSLWSDAVGYAVSEPLQHRWHYVRGASHRKLPPLLRKLGAIDVFVHDSLHSYEVMTFEMEHAWDVLPGGGFLVVDDIHENPAFQDFVGSHAVGGVVYAADPQKQGIFGIVRKGVADGG